MHGALKRVAVPGVLGLSFMAMVLTSATIDRVAPRLTHSAAPHSQAISHVRTSDAKAPRPGKPHHLLSGLASWYGGMFDGRRTANGEIYDETAMTACHRTLPFGTLVRVINLRTRQSVIVRINDRGELRPDRIIDLSSAAAERIGMLEDGLAPVKLVILHPAHG